MLILNEGWVIIVLSCILDELVQIVTLSDGQSWGGEYNRIIWIKNKQELNKQK